jgi:hypothetical protein
MELHKKHKQETNNSKSKQRKNITASLKNWGTATDAVLAGKEMCCVAQLKSASMSFKIKYHVCLDELLVNSDETNLGEGPQFLERVRSNSTFSADTLAFQVPLICSWYWKLKDEAQDHTLCRSQFGRGYGPVARQTTTWLEFVLVITVIQCSCDFETISWTIFRTQAKDDSIACF